MAAGTALGYWDNPTVVTIYVSGSGAPTVIGAVGQAEREAVLERQREGITTSKREAG